MLKRVPKLTLSTDVLTLLESQTFISSNPATSYCGGACMTSQVSSSNL